MVSDFQSLTSATKTFILDVTGVLNSPLFCTREEFHEERFHFSVTYCISDGVNFDVISN